MLFVGSMRDKSMRPSHVIDEGEGINALAIDGRFAENYCGDLRYLIDMRFDATRIPLIATWTFYPSDRARFSLVDETRKTSTHAE